MIRVVVVCGAVVCAAATSLFVAARSEHDSASIAAAAASSAVQRVRSAPTTAAVLSRPAAARSRPAAHRVRPQPDACAGIRDRTVLVSLSAQHLWLCDGSSVDADFAVTTGRHAHGDRTPTGTYDVQARTRDTTLDPSTGSTYHVKYWLPFKWGIYGFHDAPWQRIPFGSQRYRTDGSDGCVHMREPDIKRMFGWVHLGTPVTIRA